MKKVICMNGHFYDSDRFDVCPVCGQGSDGPMDKPEPHGDSMFESEETVPLPQSFAIDELASTAWLSPDEMRRLWGDDVSPMEVIPQECSDRQETAEELQETDASDQRIDELAPTEWKAPDLDLPSEHVEGGEATPAEADTAIPEGSDAPALGEVDTTVSEDVDVPETNKPDFHAEEVTNTDEPVEPEKTCGEAAVVLDKLDADAQLRMTLAQAVAASDAVGISPVTQMVQRKAVKPVADSVSLPVGWLVGLSGSCRGKVFPCKLGRNRIGREPQMDISLPEELSVDPVSHAQIIYEPKKRQFFIQAGNGDGLSYLNNELVFTHEELHAYDRITLGEAAFVFLPLCGEFFDWDIKTCGE